MAKGTTWLRATFSVDANQINSSLDAPDFSEAPRSAYLNGHHLDSIAEDVSRLLTPGTNTLVLEVLNKKDVSAPVSLILWHNSPCARTPWYFHGGLTGLDETPIIGRVTNWSDFLVHAPWRNGQPALQNSPTFWKSTFTYHHPAGQQETLGILTTQGLKSGSLWLNGHNLGECPQKAPIYLPECWLNEGNNDLVVFDLHGAKPDQVQIMRYAVSVVSR